MSFPPFLRRFVLSAKMPPMEHIQEQINPTSIASSPTEEDWYWGRMATGEEEDFLWRRLSDTWYQKDVLPATYLELHNLCYEAYNANPLAFAVIEITTSFVLGKGVTVVANRPEVQRVLMDFWHDPDNHMEMRVYSLCTELALYGEQFIRFFVNPYSGRVKIRQIDPSLIDEIETDPEDIETVLRFHRRPVGPNATQPGDPVPLSTSRPQDFDGEWFQAGSEMLQFCVNKVSNARRGKSDLATLLPWLRRYKDWLSDRVRINKYKGAFLWDVQLAGADRKTIERKKAEYSYPPEPGTIIIHGDAERWTAIKPEINANDVSEDGRALKLMVAIGCQLPEHYLSDGNNGNRATATEMGLPTLLKFQRRQYVLKYMLRSILDRVLLEACKTGELREGSDLGYEIIFPKIDVDDHATLAASTNTLVNALGVAKAQGWISDETAMRLLFQFAGAEVDIAEEQARIRQEEK